MYGTDVYEKVYFRDDYQQQFKALRDRFHERTQNALAGRAVDHTPVPNATTIIHMHELEDGGVRITTGDFVEYFNRRYGGKDRMGACRAALANAAQKAEKKSAVVGRQKSETAREVGVIACRMRFSKTHLMLVNAMFAIVLLLSLILLAASDVMLRHSEIELATAKQQVAQVEEAQTAEMLSSARAADANDDYLAYSTENTVAVYEAEEQESFFVSILNALSYLW